MSKRSTAQSAEPARWSVKVSRETDDALRTLLAARGARRGDLSRFVEDAVNREVLREMAGDIQKRNAGRDSHEIERIVEEELREVRSSFWADTRT